MSDNFDTSGTWADDIDVFEVSSSEGSTDFNTGGGSSDGSFLEQRCTGFADVVAKRTWVVACTSHEVVAVLVVVRTAVKHIHPKVDLGDVAAVGRSAGDVDDREGHTSTLTRVHVVGVGVVKTDTVVVGVATGGIAWWVSNVSGLTRAA